VCGHSRFTLRRVRFFSRRNLIFTIRNRSAPRPVVSRSNERCDIEIAVMRSSKTAPNVYIYLYIQHHINVLYSTIRLLRRWRYNPNFPLKLTNTHTHTHTHICMYICIPFTRSIFRLSDYIRPSSCWLYRRIARTQTSSTATGSSRSNFHNLIVTVAGRVTRQRRNRKKYYAYYFCG